MNKINLFAGLTVLSVLSASAETVIVNLGNSDVVDRETIDTQGLGAGINPSNWADAINAISNDTVSFTFVYDLSGLGIGTANTLEIAATGSDLLNPGGAWGLAVEESTALNAANNRFDVGETLSFVMTVKDSGGVDISGDMSTFSFSGFSAKGLNRDLAGTGDPLTITAAGQSLDFGTSNVMNNKTGFDIDLSSLTSPYSFDATRSGQNDIAQFSQLQFEIIPEPGNFALLSGLLALGAVMIRRRG